MRLRLAVAPAVVALSLTVVPAAGFAGEPRAHAADLDCADFSSQRDAQDYFVSIGGPTSDPDRLDGDSDGQACDSLPCPCGASGNSAPAPSTTPERRKTARVIQARITKVTDGDTVKVQAYGAQRSSYTVRLVGIHTPRSTASPSAAAPARARTCARSRSMGTATAAA